MNEMHEPRVLPRVFALTTGAFLPLRFVKLSKRLACEQIFAGLAQDGLDHLPALPALPQGGGGQRNQLSAVLNQRRLLAGVPTPVGKLEQRSTDKASRFFGSSVVPTVAVRHRDLL